MPGPRYYPRTYFVRRYLPSTDTESKESSNARRLLPAARGPQSCLPLVRSTGNTTGDNYDIVVPCEPNGDGWVGRQGTKIQLRRYGLGARSYKFLPIYHTSLKHRAGPIGRLGVSGVVGIGNSQWDPGRVPAAAEGGQFFVAAGTVLVPAYATVRHLTRY